MKKLICGNLLAAAMVFGFAAATNAQRIAGGYSSVAVDDASVVAAAGFAVDKRVETNTEQEGMKLDSIDKAESQVVAGRNFRLCMTVSMDTEHQQVQAVVYQNLQQKYSLTSWNPVETCGTAGTRYPGTGGVRASKCSGAMLSVVGGDADADMGGKRWVKYVFTNISKVSCMMKGYPAISFFNKAGKKMAVSATNDNEFLGSDAAGKAPENVTIGPGEKTSFQIFYNDGMAMEPHKRVSESAKAKISAPGDTKVFVISSAVQACCGVQVSSVVKVVPE